MSALPTVAISGFGCNKSHNGDCAFAQCNRCISMHLLALKLKNV